jgi:hypothetical protein
MTNQDRPDKREFYSRMGFCECASCAGLFYDYDEYLTHECTNTRKGIRVPNQTRDILDGEEPE